MILSSKVLKSTGIYQTNSPGTNLGTIKATAAAIDFYSKQAKDKQLFDANEKKNEDFLGTVCSLTSYPDWYTGDLDLPTSVWKDKCKENPEFFELDCMHGTNCNRINNCKCDPDSNKRQLQRHRKKEIKRY